MTSRFTDKNVTVLTVNYNTHDLVKRLIDSVWRVLGNDISIHIVDGSDQNISTIDNLEDITSRDNVVHHKLGFNIHHGPGMDYGISRINTPYTLILDSDSLLTSDILNIYNTTLPEDFYAAGHACYVDTTGHINGDSNGKNNGNVSKFNIKYIHPACLLIDNNRYKNYRPFRKHGAPCLDNMIDVNNRNESELLIHIDNDELWEHNGRGTIDRWTLNI